MAGGVGFSACCGGLGLIAVADEVVAVVWASFGSVVEVVAVVWASPDIPGVVTKYDHRT